MNKEFYQTSRSFSVSGRPEKRDDGPIKEKKRVSHQRESKNNLFQRNRKESSPFGFEETIPNVVGSIKPSHDKKIPGGNVQKAGKENWSPKTKGVLDRKESKKNLSQRNRKESSPFGFEETIPNLFVGGKPSHEGEIKGGNVQKAGKENWSKKRKGVLDKKDTKNNLFQGNRKESSLFGFEESISKGVIGGKPSHATEIRGGDVQKGEKENWSLEKKGVLNKKETKINHIPPNTKKSSVDFKIIGVEKAAHDTEIKDGNVKKEKPSAVNSDDVGVEKRAQRRGIKGGIVEKKKNEFKYREKKSAYQKLSQAQGLEESKKSGYQTHLKDQNLQRKDKKFHNVTDHQQQIQVSNLKGNKKISHDNKKFNTRWKQPRWLHNRVDDKYISVRHRLKQQMTLGVKEIFEKQVTVVQGFFPVIDLAGGKKFTQVERCFAIQQRLYGQTHPAVAVSPLKKLMKSHYIAKANNWLVGKPKLSENIQSKGIKILHKNSPKNIKLQQMMHKSLLKAKPVMHKSSPKGNVLYRLKHTESKRGASHQASPKDIINRWLSMEVKSPDQIKTKDHKRSHKSPPKSKGLHRVAHKNLTNKSNLHGTSHQRCLKFLPEGTPQTSFNHGIICKVNHMWCMVQKIVRKTQKLLQEQNKKIQDLERKLVTFYKRKKRVKPKDCEIKFITKFKNMLMRDGKKSKAHTILYKSLKLFRTYLENMSVQEEFIQKLAETDGDNYAVHCLRQAVENVKPSLEVRRKKISGIIRQIPAVPSEKRQRSVSIRWILESARKRKKKSSKPFFQCLAEEFLDAYKNQGEPYKKKQALHDTAEASRVYIRFRWW